ncbi:MAG: M6 family metalloprotease domain-containing protein [Chloroflexi bacterium]|nr:M6 family metalloprotease domain-containing protein [Chloroflexota bacterium]
MPPHPGLRERMLRGEVILPESIDQAPSAGDDFGIAVPRTPANPQAMLGTIRALAVLVDFNDKVRTTSASFFDTLIFEPPKPGRGSVRDYYSEVSYGQVDIVSVNLPSSLGWQRAPQPYNEYVDAKYCISGSYPRNCQKLAEEIVDAIDGVVNFADYDNNHDGVAEPIMLIHAGPGAEYSGSTNDIWSHAWSLKTARILDGVRVSRYVMMPEYWINANAASSDMTIGVFTHEMGHGFWGLRDLYDRDYSSYGIGSWSMMSSGSWNGPGYLGSSPAWPDAWSRIKMGFTAPVVVTTNISAQTIRQTYGNPGANLETSTVFELHSPLLGSREYFLVENRQRVAGSYDEYLPGAGLLIWHVDEAMDSDDLYDDFECVQSQCCSCDETAHYLVSLEQADGQLQLEKSLSRGDGGDPFPGSSDRRAFGTTASAPYHSSWYACDDTCIGVTNISPSGPVMSADLRVACIALVPRSFLPLVREP